MLNNVSMGNFKTLDWSRVPVSLLGMTSQGTGFRLIVSQEQWEMLSSSEF